MRATCGLRPRPRSPQPEGLDIVPPSVLRAYITLARRQQPFVDPALQEYIAGPFREVGVPLGPRDHMHLRLSRCSLPEKFRARHAREAG